MKKLQIIVKTNYALIFGLILMLPECTQMSEKETDTDAGLNGGFELARNGLPVNWLMYTPKTVPDSDFEIVLDRDEFKEGKQSLKIKVDRCSSTGGWHSPGFTSEFFEVGKYEGEGVYKLSFWIKNNGTTFNISGGGVAAKEDDMKTLIENNEQIDEWQHMEFKINVPKDRWLRMQLNILKPGTFWIDDITIERV